jgi:hypothetical protein
MAKTWVVIASLCLVVACGGKKKDEEKKKLADLCVQATDMLQKDSGSASNDTFELMLQNALTACSQACDDEDQPSCTSLDGHIHKLCGVAPDICKKLCDSVKSPSLKKASCEFKK